MSVVTTNVLLSLSSSILEDTLLLYYFQSCPCFNYRVSPEPTKDDLLLLAVCWLFNIPATDEVYLRGEQIRQSDTLRQKLLIKLAISPSLSMLTTGQLVQALTPHRRASGRAVSRVLNSNISEI